MAFDFVTKEEIQQLIEEEELYSETQMGILEGLLEALDDGGTVFHDKDTDEWFLVPKGQPIPKHLESVILRE